MASRRTHPYPGVRVPVALPVLADSVYPISSVFPVDNNNKASGGFISLANHLASPELAPRAGEKWPAGQAGRVRVSLTSAT
jgi:hypothetical protein